MVSPTLVDMNNDGVRDIVMSAYDGTMRLYDGETLDVIWTTRFYGFESYSCLAPAYFNDDEHLDFMIHLNRGAWPNYKYSLKVVLDGRNGKVMWQMNATFYEMASDLVMRTTEKHRDAFVFRIEGVNGPDMNMVDHKLPPLGPISEQNFQLNAGVSQYPPFSLHRPSPGESALTAFISSHRDRVRQEQEERQKRSSGENIDKNNIALQASYSNDVHIDRARNATHKMKDADSNSTEVYKFFNDTDINDLNFTIVNDSNSDDGNQNADKPADISASCAYDMMSYMTQFMMLDRSNVHAPNILYQLPPIKFFRLNFTEEEKKTIYQNIQNRQRFENQRKMGGSPSRRRRFKDTEDAGPYCVVLWNDERTTGVIGDVDGDGELDKVAIVASEGELHGQTIDHVRIVKINMFDAIKTRGRYRSRLNTYISEEMRNVRGIKPLEQMEFRPMTEQPWTQYMGKSGDGIYRGID
ncbi:hypothetical protein LSAT2_029235 [Lamellibrachia satsuma]|nr:hypothetical protein LSAT2_029235 [Lamellibrachia satsuma]